MPRHAVHAASILLLAACASPALPAGATPAAQADRPPALPPVAQPVARPARVTFLPTSVPQGSLVVGLAGPDAVVEYEGRRLRQSVDGRFVFGIGRDATGEAEVRIAYPGKPPLVQRIAIMPRDWPVENVKGVPPATVNPPPAIAERIAREQAQVTEARMRDDDRDEYTERFTWPVQGRISGRFGNQRVYNGTPKSPHSGMDIAAASGTPVKAPAGGVVTYANPDMYLTGGTILLDHGHGVSSNFLHLSRLDVKVGDRVAQGQVIGAVGATGRATGPHLHWGMNWFDTRVDPLLVLEASGAAAPP